jgi:hypothetical protein
MDTSYGRHVYKMQLAQPIEVETLIQKMDNVQPTHILVHYFPPKHMEGEYMHN